MTKCRRVCRTGEWFFAGSQAGEGVVPDIVTLAKALAAGFRRRLFSH